MEHRHECDHPAGPCICPVEQADPIEQRIHETLSTVGSLSPDALGDEDKVRLISRIVAQGVRELIAQPGKAEAFSDR